MIGFRLDQAKSMFFDKQAVLSAADRATMKVLSKFGAYVRTRARQSMRTAKGPSSPGSPPHAHGAALIKRFLFFVYDRINRSVVMGPAKINRKTYGPTTVPELQEEGGMVSSKRHSAMGFAPRPFMGPAFSKELEKAPDLWKNSIT